MHDELRLSRQNNLGPAHKKYDCPAVRTFSATFLWWLPLPFRYTLFGNLGTLELVSFRTKPSQISAHSKSIKWQLVSRCWSVPQKRQEIFVNIILMPADAQMVCPLVNYPSFQCVRQVGNTAHHSARVRVRCSCKTIRCGFFCDRATPRATK